MNGHKGNKINHLLKNWPAGTVATSYWFEEQEIYRQLVQCYRKSNWIDRIGHGAFIRSGDTVGWEGAVFAVQEQLNLPVYVGGKTALQMRGYGHFLQLGEKPPVFLFGEPGKKLPLWFDAFREKVDLHYVMANLFSGEKPVGLTKKSMGTFEITLSSPERAILEMLYLVPQEESFEEASLLMEGLNTLRPQLVQSLLEQCRSIKVKRFFLYLAENQNLPWVKKINTSRINLGKGKRSLVKGGRFDSKYQISVPK